MGSEMCIRDSPYIPPSSHLQPPTTAAHLNPETARFKNLMSVPYADHHAHLSPSFYSTVGFFGAIESAEQKHYNFDTDVGTDQISLRRRLSFPYFYSPVISRPSFSSPILHSHLHSSDIEFPSSLTSHDDLESQDSSHSIDLGCTENDDVINISGSRDNHVIELPELRQPTIRVSDSVRPYVKMFPFSPPPSTHTPTPQSQITPITDTGVQETGGGGRDQPQAASSEDQHRQDFQNGRIDYTGRDSFDSIQQRIDALLADEDENEQGGEVDDDEA